MKWIKLFILVTLITPLAAQETLPPYHWANDYIEYFIVRGDLQSINKLNRPYARMAVTKALLKLDPDDENYSAKEKEMLKKLLREFEFEGNQLAENVSAGGWLQLMNKALKALGQSSQNDLAFRAGGYGILGYQSFSLNDSSLTSFQLNPNAVLSWQDLLTLHLNIRIFNKAPQNYIGKKFAGLYAYSEQNHISLSTEWFGIKFGRDYMQHGPGKSGQLLFSDNSRTFDMYHVRLGKNSFQFSFWGFLLDPVSTAGTSEAKFAPLAKRYLNGHRISFTIAEKYRFAVSEVILYGAANRGWETGLMNPLMFYYGYNLNTPGIDGNILYNFEWDLYFSDHIELYGEFLLDDYQIDDDTRGDQEPNELGLITGINWAKPFNINGALLNAEYVQVRNRTYNVQGKPWEKYLHRNEVIGYALGNNLERFQLAIDYWLQPDLQITLNTSLTRQGSGSPQGEFNTDFLLEDNYSEPFPFGTVESNLHFGIEVFYRPVNFGHIDLRIGRHNYTNLNHIPGNDETDLQISADLWLQWDWIFQPSE